jgi:hypothetical protein
MKLNEEQLKELYQQSAGRSGRSADCLQEELLRRAAAREISDGERLRVVAHMRSCGDCARKYRIAHATREWAAEVAPLLENDQAAPAPGNPSPGRPWWQHLLQPFGGRAAGFAALALLAVIASFIAWRVIRPGAGAPPVERGSANIRLSIMPPDKALLEAAPAQLSWSKVEAVESYQVTLYDFELTPLWESLHGGATSVQLPEAVRAKLPLGQSVYWRVTLLTGIERRQSELFQFTLKAPAN